MATGAGELREYTPLLVTGRDGSNTVLKEGELAPGLEGVVCEHVFADATSRQEATVVVTSVPETVAYMPALVCRDRATLGAEPAQLPAERWMPVELESAEFNRRYRLLTLAGQDPGWVRELFSPALIAWLADRAPAGLSFELNEGHLVVAQPGPPGGAGAVDGLVSAAAELRTRLRAEALEEEAEPDLFDEAAEVAAVVATIDEVRLEGAAGERWRGGRALRARGAVEAEGADQRCVLGDDRLRRPARAGHARGARHPRDRRSARLRPRRLSS